MPSHFSLISPCLLDKCSFLEKFCMFLHILLKKNQKQNCPMPLPYHRAWNKVEFQHLFEEQMNKYVFTKDCMYIHSFINSSEHLEYLLCRSTVLDVKNGGLEQLNKKLTVLFKAFTLPSLNSLLLIHIQLWKQCIHM